MKKELDLTALEPSKFSAIGFLGNDTRPVETIIEEDLAALAREGFSQVSMADALEKIHRAARGLFGAEANCGQDLVAVHYDSRAQLPCPFGDGLFEKGETLLAVSGSDKKFVLTSLSIHLIHTHGFFQGRGSRYRIEPVEAVAIAKRLNL